MDNYVITIARGFGSGGKRIAIELAKQLGINCYENRILTLASQYSGYDESYFVEQDEKLKGSLWINQLSKLPVTTTPKPVINKFKSDTRVFEAQKHIIERLAKTESCIIVGKCADYILRDYDNVLSVFVHAPFEFCMEQAAKKHSLSEKELEKYIIKTDKNRADYYKYHTGREWTDARNYDLCLDSSKLGFERCVDEITAYIKVRFGDVF